MLSIAGTITDIATEIYLYEDALAGYGLKIHATHQSQESEEDYVLEHKEECFVEVR